MGFAGHSAHYHYDVKVKEKLNTIYVHPLTGAEYKVTVSYKINDKISHAIENNLLHSPEYSNWDDKQKCLIPMYSSAIEARSYALWPTVTGLEFHTTEHGVVQWRMFEDEEEIVRRIPVTEIPHHILRIELCDLTPICNLLGSVSTVLYNGDTYVMKVHEYASQNDDFPTEVNALIKLGKVPHVVQMIGVIVQRSSLDGETYVQGILLPYCDKRDLKSLLEEAAPKVNAARKDRWAAQITHGVMAIHQAGLVHGDIKCGNIVVDKFDDAHLIDIINGDGFTEGWRAIGDNKMDPRRDIYSLGVTFWEIIHDGADPLGESVPLVVNEKATGGEKLKRLVQECVVEDVTKRPLLAEVYAALGSRINCGCLQE